MFTLLKTGHCFCCMSTHLIEIGSWNKPYEEKDLMEE